jgi:hypothetical protein
MPFQMLDYHPLWCILFLIYICCKRNAVLMPLPGLISDLLLYYEVDNIDRRLIGTSCVFIALDAIVITYYGGDP